MKKIVRIYLPKKGGGEDCIKDPKKIVGILSKLTEELDIDLAAANGHVKMATTKDLIGETIGVDEGEETYSVVIPQH